ncbi:MAG: twin-arginine translocation pathway signal protein, partial [Proteobacteria bacterium]|nr:twin-arginine translocation pathway signal protein [Pseudomonadota bacterium]
MKRISSSLLSVAVAACAVVGLQSYGSSALAQDANERVRKISFYTWPQAAMPQIYQASQLIAQSWRALGLDVEVKPLERNAQTQLIWYEREKWDVTMWRMVGRPERSDPDEFAYNLFHSTTAPKGYNLVGYLNPEYDKIAELQRSIMDPEKRRQEIFKAQEIVNRDQPYAFLVHPKGALAFNKAMWDEKTIVNQSGIGIRNIWTFLGLTPLTQQKDLILNSSEPINATNPLYISGATDSWVTDLVWDRLMRIGADGLPKPWAAESVKWVNDTTLDVTIRAGMKWHDGRPVTADDVVFSFQAPAMGDKSPMYKPFVMDIASVSKTGDNTIRFVLKGPNAPFLTSSIAKINLIPKHIWEPVMADLMTKPENAEKLSAPSHIGSGPFKCVQYVPGEKAVFTVNPYSWRVNSAGQRLPFADGVIIKI